MANPESSLPGLTPAHIEVRYGDSLLVPAPLIAYSQSVERNDANDRESVLETRVLTGVILTDELGYQFVSDKQKELEEAFSQDNLELTIRASAAHPSLASGTYIVSGIFPRVNSIEVAEDVQFNRLDYTISLENTVLASGVTGAVESFEDSWEFTESADNGIIEISHSVSAQGLNTASGSVSNALENARSRVNDVLGLSAAPESFPFYAQPESGVGVGFWELNTSRSESIDVANSSISVTEEFVLVSGVQPYYDERTATFSVSEDGVKTVAINGTVQGLGRTNDGPQEAAGRTGGGTGFQNPVDAFNNNIRPALFADASGIYERYEGTGTLSDNVQSLSVVQNLGNGSIGYSVSFTDDPAANLPSGIVDASCSIQINSPVQVVAEQTVPFRALGAIFQRICTTTPGSYQIQCAATAENTGDSVADTNRAIDYVEGEVARLQPDVNDYVDIYFASKNQTTNDVDRSVTVSASWTFSEDLSTVPEASGIITFDRVT
jgi:hypothetical protein